MASDAKPLFKHETSFLHLRHICEVIAIACLAAQGDYETHRAFTEEYSPPKIFNALRALYPNFFPQPSETVSANGAHHLTANARPGAYAEADVIKLWNVAGSHLHRASLTRYISTTFKPPPDLRVVSAHVDGIIRLLESHVVPIQFAEERLVLLNVDMNDGDGGIAARFLKFDTEKSEMTVEGYKALMA